MKSDFYRKASGRRSLGTKKEYGVVRLGESLFSEDWSGGYNTLLDFTPAIIITEDFDDFAIPAGGSIVYSEVFSGSINTTEWEVQDVGSITVDDDTVLGDSLFGGDALHSPASGGIGFITVKAASLSQANMRVEVDYYKDGGGVHRLPSIGARITSAATAANGDGYWFSSDGGGNNRKRLWERTNGVNTNLINQNPQLLDLNGGIGKIIFVVEGTFIIALWIDENGKPVRGSAVINATHAGAAGAGLPNLFGDATEYWYQNFEVRNVA